MTINAKQVLKDFKGKNIVEPDGADFTVGMGLSTILLHAKEGGKMKMFLLAQKFYEGKSIEVDEADLGIIKKAVETSDVYTNNLIPGSLLMILNKTK